MLSLGRITVGVIGILLGSSALAQDRPSRTLQRTGIARRVALCIGNDTYPGMPLKNAVNDARAMSRVLADIGFETRLKENTTKVGLEQAVDEFVASLGSGDVGLFYYAGHGIEIERENYLIPVDFNGRTRADAKYESYAARRVLDKMQESGAKFRMMVLDACRNNPYGGRSGAGGLHKMDAATGEFIAFATSPSRTASDNPVGGNGLFTSHLIKALKQPGLRVQDLFDRVRSEVYAASNHTQVPYAENGVIGDFYPHPGPSAAPPEPSATGPFELAFWDSIKASDDPRDFKDYLERVANGQFTGAFASLARHRLDRLDRPPTAPATTAATPGSAPPGPSAASSVPHSPRKEERERLVEMLGRPEAKQRRLAVEGFGRLADPASLPALKKDYQRERDDEVRLAYSFALVLTGDRAYIDTLVLSLAAKKHARQARDYLIELGRPVLPDLYPYLNDPDPGVRAALCDIMGELGDADAIRHLKPLLNDPSAAVASAADRALARLGKLQQP
jgi:hypothetical protein